jgi:hypothetical protein
MHIFINENTFILTHMCVGREKVSLSKSQNTTNDDGTSTPIRVVMNYEKKCVARVGSICFHSHRSIPKGSSSSLAPSPHVLKIQ